MSFRFVHAADLHLDTPFEGLTTTDPALKQRLTDASLEALDALVALAVREGALFVALAGDVYDGAERGLRAQIRLLDATRLLDAAGIWTFIAHGNHDPVTNGWTAIRAWPEKVHIFAADRASSVALIAGDGTPVTVTGTSFPTRDVREGLHIRFRPPASPGFHVAVLHANVGGAVGHASYSPCTVEDLVARGYDAWLLGHVHARSVLRAAAPFIAYSGNIQGRSFKPSERGPKGALCVEVEHERITPRFVPLAPVTFEECAVDVSSCADVAAVIDALAALPPSGAPGERFVVTRGRLTGRSAIYADLAGENSRSALLSALRDRCPAHHGRVWTDLILDVAAPIDRDALRSTDSLPGELVREIDRLRGAPGALRTLLGESAGLRDLFADLSDEEIAACVDPAGDLALHLLVKEA